MNLSSPSKLWRLESSWDSKFSDRYAYIICVKTLGSSNARHFISLQENWWRIGERPCTIDGLYWRTFLCSAKEHRGCSGWLVMTTLSPGLSPHITCSAHLVIRSKIDFNNFVLDTNMRLLFIFIIIIYFVLHYWYINIFHLPQKLSTFWKQIFE